MAKKIETIEAEHVDAKRKNGADTWYEIWEFDPSTQTRKRLQPKLCRQLSRLSEWVLELDDRIVKLEQWKAQ